MIRGAPNDSGIAELGESDASVRARLRSLPSWQCASRQTVASSRQHRRSKVRKFIESNNDVQQVTRHRYRMSGMHADARTRSEVRAKKHGSRSARVPARHSPTTDITILFFPDYRFAAASCAASNISLFGCAFVFAIER